MDDWLSAIEDELIDDSERGGPSNNVEEEAGLVGVASDGLLLSQEDIYQLDEGFQDSDTEVLLSIFQPNYFFILHCSFTYLPMKNTVCMMTK